MFALAASKFVRLILRMEQTNARGALGRAIVLEAWIWAAQIKLARQLEPYAGKSADPGEALHYLRALSGMLIALTALIRHVKERLQEKVDDLPMTRNAQTAELAVQEPARAIAPIRLGRGSAYFDSG